MNKTILTFLALFLTANTAAAQAPTIKVLIAGDSLTSSYSQIDTWAIRWRDSRPDLHIHNAAYGGNSSVQVYNSVVQAWQNFGPFDYVVIMAGVNDPGKLVTNGAYHQLKAAKYAKKRGATPVLITAPGTLNRGSAVNVYMAEQAKLLRSYRRGKYTLDLRDKLSLRGFASYTADGTHPTDEGHQYLLGLIKPDLDNIIGARR